MNNTRRALCCHRAAVACAVLAGLSLPAAFAPASAQAQPQPAIESAATVPNRGQNSPAAGTAAQPAPVPQPAPGPAAQPAPGPAPQPAPKPSALKDLKTLDAEIMRIGDPVQVVAKVKDGTLPRENQRMLLERAFVERAGFDILQKWSTQSKDHAGLMQWLLTDVDTLGLVVTAGLPGQHAVQNASVNNPQRRSQAYELALNQLLALCRKHGDDIKPIKSGEQRTETGEQRTESDRMVFRKMMIAAAWGMDGGTHLWAGNADRPADPTGRYEIIKKFRANAAHYKFYKEIFDKLPVELMRWVFENRISNEELPWLANYTLNFKKADGSAPNESERLGAYTYTYTDSKGGVNFRWDNDTFYNKHDIEVEAKVLDRPATQQNEEAPVKGGWRELYKFTYDDPNFPNAKEGDPYRLAYEILDHDQIQKLANQGKHPARLWMVFQRGGVCGAIAKTFENLNGMAGIPSTVHGMPGHAATLKYTLKKNKASGKTEPFWVIQNNVTLDEGAGWLQTQTPEANHKVCGWEEVHDGPTRGDQLDHKYASPETDNHMYMRWGGGPYLLLAQECLEDMKGYAQVFMLRALADATADAQVKEHVIDVALQVQGGNQDAELAKVKLLAARKAPATEWIAFAAQVCESLKYQPLPLHSMMKYIIQQGDSELLGPIEAMRITALQRACMVEERDYNQYMECRQLAKALLGRKDATAAKLDLAGASNGTISLGVQFAKSPCAWQYSVDGGKQWIQVAKGEQTAQLGREQIAQITADNDVRVKIGEVPDSGIVTIDVTEGKAPERPYANDNDNKFYTPQIANNPDNVARYEVKRGDSWIPLAQAQPFEGNREVEVRSACSGSQLASNDSVKVTFTDNKTPGMAFVPYDQLAVNSFSSSQQGEGGAKTVLNGYVPSDSNDGEFWHSKYDREDNPWITIDLGKTRTIKAFDFWKRTRGGNGVPNGTVRVLVAQDGSAVAGKPGAGQAVGGAAVPPAEAFALAREFTVGGQGLQWENGKIRFAFDAPVRGRYIKIQRMVSRDYLTCAQLDFYELDTAPLKARIDQVREQIADASGYTDESLAEVNRLLAEAEKVASCPVSAEALDRALDSISPQNIAAVLKEAVTVTFDYVGAPEGVVVPQPVKLERGAALGDGLVEPQVPEGYAFEGWFRDRSCSAQSKVTGETVLDESVTLYGKWVVSVPGPAPQPEPPVTPDPKPPVVPGPAPQPQPDPQPQPAPHPVPAPEPGPAAQSPANNDEHIEPLTQHNNAGNQAVHPASTAQSESSENMAASRQKDSAEGSESALEGSAEEVRKLSRSDASEGTAPSFLAPVLAAGAAVAASVTAATLFVRRKK